MHPTEEYDRARHLLASGLSIDAVARRTGVPRSTIGYWRRTSGLRGRRTRPVAATWTPPEPASYRYLLGLCARYFFSNLSEDIKDVFCEHCDLLGVAWSRANPRHVSVHDRRSVVLLDSFVGPKS